jgi:hypothetical protein
MSNTNNANFEARQGTWQTGDAAHCIAGWAEILSPSTRKIKKNKNKKKNKKRKVFEKKLRKKIKKMLKTLDKLK